MGALKKRVLFICTHNSARSQMAEGFLRALYGDEYEAYSGGTEPKGIDPRAVKVMAEVGVDISGQRSKGLGEFGGWGFDYVVTVCDRAKEACPFFPGGKIFLHKGFEDPSQLKGTEEEILAGFRRVRDEIRDWIEETFGGRHKAHGD
ncbi:MAG: arsenate reductase ArsC [Candidatus Bathyarchaeia archaeon]